MTVYNLSAKQKGHASTILGIARKRGLPDKAGEYGIACSGAEASLINWANAGTSTHVAKGGKISGRQLNDAERAETRKSLGSPSSDGTPPWGDNLDSCGLFAQRWIEGWGNVMDIMKPDYSTGKFLDALIRVNGWEQMAPGDVIKKVQGYYSDIYTDWLDTAQAYVRANPRPGQPPTPPTAGKGNLTFFNVYRMDSVDYVACPGRFRAIVSPDDYHFMSSTGWIDVPHGAGQPVARNLLEYIRNEASLGALPGGIGDIIN